MDLVFFFAFNGFGEVFDGFGEVFCINTEGFDYLQWWLFMGIS